MQSIVIIPIHQYHPLTPSSACYSISLKISCPVFIFVINNPESN